MKVRFHHCHVQQEAPGRHRIINKHLEDALKSGQIAGHKADPFLPSVRGVTVCILEDDDKNEIVRGYSFCSWQDRWNRAKGRLISEGRARKNLRA